MRTVFFVGICTICYKLNLLQSFYCFALLKMISFGVITKHERQIIHHVQIMNYFHFGEDNWACECITACIHIEKYPQIISSYNPVPLRKLFRFFFFLTVKKCIRKSDIFLYLKIKLILVFVKKIAHCHKCSYFSQT